jgi:DNA-binding transcriptional ArsR family regulator
VAYIANTLAALADPTRREIFERVARRPSSVAEIARNLPVSRPAVSQHLKVLKTAGLVTDRAEGTRRVYQIDPKGLGPIRAWLDQMWDANLAAFKEAVEADAEDDRE